MSAASAFRAVPPVSPAEPRLSFGGARSPKPMCTHLHRGGTPHAKRSPILRPGRCDQAEAPEGFAVADSREGNGGRPLRADKWIGPHMFFSLFLTCATALGISTILLLLVGHRLRVGVRPLGLLLAVGVTLAAGELAAAVWHLPPADVERGQAVLLAATVVVVLARRDWNPVGQVFFGSFVAAALVYLAFALYVTFGTG